MSVSVQQLPSVDLQQSPLRADRVLRSVPLPNGAVRREHCDFLGRVHVVEEPELRHCLFNKYDASGQLTEVHDGSTKLASYTSDSQQGEFTARTARTETRIRADDQGRPLELALCVDQYRWTIAFEWSEDGRLAGLLYPQAADWLRFERSGSDLELKCGAQTHLVAKSGQKQGHSRLEVANGAVIVEEIVPGRTPRLQRVAHFDRDGNAAFDTSYECDAHNRVLRAGSEMFEYDLEGRLSRSTSPRGERRYRYTSSGRLRAIEPEVADFLYQEAPMVAEVIRGDDRIRFGYDASGRRITKQSPEGVTHYEYDSFGQLSVVRFTDGGTIRYLYDGFGRLVAQESASGCVYFVTDLQGHRLAEADETGRIIRSYLWLGGQCQVRVDGTLTDALSHSFHRAHAGRLAAVGDALGQLKFIPGLDPFGADAAIQEGVPGFASLFGDPETGLLYAGSRWLDPGIAQFLSPDTWFGRDVAECLPPVLRRYARAAPGGPSRDLTPEAAYNWCAHDPVNFTDPHGHSWYGLILSFFSAALWEMQLTSLSLQMEVINILLEVFQWFPLFRPTWGWDKFFSTSIFNANVPMASSRLNVPFAIPLNGLLRMHDRGWTLGSVIWVRGDKWRSVDKTAKRDLLICNNAATYIAATEEAAADVFHARSPFARATATGAGAQVTGVTITAPAGGAIPDIFRAGFASGDFVSIRKPGDPTDEIRRITNIAAGAFDLSAPPLPANYAGPVEITRLDSSVVKIAKDDSLIARTVTFIRGTSVHFARQIPEGFPVDDLTITEYMPSGKRDQVTADSHTEFYVVRMAATADRALYAANDFVRVRSGAKYFARNILRLRGAKDLILADPLPNPTPSTYATLEIAKMELSGLPAARQTAAGDRVNAGQLTDLRKFDGLTIENTGAAAVTTERRIVLSLLIDCQVTALPASLVASPIKIEQMNVDASRQADGTNTAAAVITCTTAGDANRFSSGKWVRVRKAPDTDAFTKVTGIDDTANTITLADPLLGPDFPISTPVTVTLLAVGRSFEAEDVIAPGDHIKIKTDDPTGLGQDNIVRAVLKSNSDTAAVRKISAAPIVVAVVDSAVPATHIANLTIVRFVSDAASLRSNVSAPQVQLRFTVHGAAPAFVANDTLFLSGTEEAWGSVFAPPLGQDIFLTDPIDFPLAPVVTIFSITGTAIVTTSANLDESRILIPSAVMSTDADDSDREPITHREAFEQHEMRHVFQGALWGPFLLSLPIPWLISLGFSFGDSANSVSKVMRHISVGGLDSLFACVAWGIGSLAGHAPSAADITGTLNADLKLITFPPEAAAGSVAAFTEGSPVEISKGDFSTFNFIDHLDTEARTITLRFKLEQNKFSANDSVAAHVSAFEKIRKQVNTWFSLNLESLWSEHIPQAWGRVLSKFLNRDSWFPFLGIYPLSLMAAGFNEDRLPNEQDAAFHSGDLYTSILISRPHEIFVGQFAAIFGFLHPRRGSGAEQGNLATGLSRFGDPLRFLTVELPTTGATAEQVAGAILEDAAVPAAGATPAVGAKVRFRENWYIQMSEKVENVVGAYFATSAPGDYLLHAPGELEPGLEIVFTKFAFDVGFLKFRKIKVNALTVTPNPDATHPVFETEEVRFDIPGDSTAEYRIRYKAPPPATPGVISGLRFTAPLLGAAANAVHTLEITATYPAAHPVFHGPGQMPNIKLTPEQRTNLCQELPVNISALTAPAVGPLAAGRNVAFDTPIAARSVRVTSPLPAGAAAPARVILGTGRPAHNTFFAPNAVTAASDVVFELVFGTAPNLKAVNVTIRVTP